MSSFDLRSYFPAYNSFVYFDKYGNPKTRYTFQDSPPGFLSLYNGLMKLQKSGRHYTWKKDYWKNGSWCTSTYAVLFMGDDLSVTEVGDWRSSSGCVPDVAFGYKTALNGGVSTGLGWAPPGGISDTPKIVELYTAAQSTPGSAYVTNGYQAYSKSGVIEHFDQYTVPYGRDLNGNWEIGFGRTYSDVLHIVMYHGTKGPNQMQVRCDLSSPIAANGAYYQSYKDYNSYAIELWLAAGVGVIQENTPFIEDGSYWSIPNCAGQIFDSIKDRWVVYIDNSNV